MKYIAGLAYNGKGIGANVKVPKNAELDLERGFILVYKGKQVCYKDSQLSRDHFARNDDGHGIERFALVHEILDGVIQMKKDHNDALNAIYARYPEPQLSEGENYETSVEEAAEIEALGDKPKEFFDAMLADNVLKGYLNDVGYWSAAFFNGEIEDLQRLKALLK